MANIRLIVGLGNPGLEYANTRHNVGFWFIDKLATRFKVGLHLEGRFLGECAKLNLMNQDLWLLKPQTFMNISGSSVRGLASFYKILPEEMLVIHDELDFVPGIAKLKLGGGANGHNGLKSIDQVLGKNYWRLRIGIGHPGDKNKVAEYVLKKPKLDDEILIQQALDKSESVIEDILFGKQEAAMKCLHAL